MKAEKAWDNFYLLINLSSLYINEFGTHINIL